jgi:hypothetical protein
MPDPAIRIVQNRIRNECESIGGYNVFVDRPDAEPFDEADYPAINIRAVTVQFDAAPDGQWQTMHRAKFQLDCISGREVGEAIDLINQRAVADIIAALHADRTLGGRLQDLNEIAVSGSELDGADIGSALLEIEALFFTPRGDFYTIVGQAGVHYTN